MIAADMPAGLNDAPQELRDLFTAWRACRRDGALLPRLSDYLDAPALKLQGQVAIGDLYSPEDVRIRLFGGGLADIAGDDYTRKALDPLMNPDAKAAARPVTWAALHRPCGYHAILVVKTAGGIVIECNSISLPLQPAKGVPFCLLTMLQLPERRVKPLADEDRSFVSSFKLRGWIDLGAGVPDTLTPSLP